MSIHLIVFPLFSQVTLHLQLFHEFCSALLPKDARRRLWPIKQSNSDKPSTSPANSNSDQKDEKDEKEAKSESPDTAMTDAAEPSSENAAMQDDAVDSASSDKGKRPTLAQLDADESAGEYLRLMCSFMDESGIFDGMIAYLRQHDAQLQIGKKKRLSKEKKLRKLFAKKAALPFVLKILIGEFLGEFVLQIRYSCRVTVSPYFTVYPAATELPFIFV